MMSLDRFLYTPYVRALEAAFPSGILLLTFERFVKDQAGFLNMLNKGDDHRFGQWLKLQPEATPVYLRPVFAFVLVCPADRRDSTDTGTSPWELHRRTFRLVFSPGCLE